MLRVLVMLVSPSFRPLCIFDLSLAIICSAIRPETIKAAYKETVLYADTSFRAMVLWGPCRMPTLQLKTREPTQTVAENSSWLCTTKARSFHVLCREPPTFSTRLDNTAAVLGILDAVACKWTLKLRDLLGLASLSA